MKKLLALSIIGMLALTGCAQSYSAKEVKGEIKLAVTTNANAKTYADWHISNTNADSVIANLSVKYFNKEISEKEICQAFSEIPAEDLVLFENQIRRDEMAFMLKACQENLKGRLDNFWRVEKAKFEQETVAATGKSAQKNRRFDQVVYVERDVSEGYYAVSGDLLPNQVALTFDDGPSGLYTREVLKALSDANVKATFFTKGMNVREFPNILKEIAADGHSIGTHSNSHRCLAAKKICKENNKGHMLDYEEAVEDIMSGHRAVKDVLGWVHPFFRFPYGEGDALLKKFLKDTGTGEFFWSVDSNDWRAKLKDGTVYTGGMMLNEVMNQLKARNRGLILQHDIQKKTAVFMPALLNRLYDEGYQPVVFIPKDPEAKRLSHLLGE